MLFFEVYEEKYNAIFRSLRRKIQYNFSKFMKENTMLFFEVYEEKYNTIFRSL